MYATTAQVVLRSLIELHSDASTPVSSMNGKPVDVPPPAIPGGDHYPYDLPRNLRYEQSGWRIVHQSLDVVSAIWRAGVLASG
jgi:hypothetical protein